MAELTSNLNIGSRRQFILDMLDSQGQLLVNEISQELKVTPVTIRSDFAALEKAGYLKRIPGGAVKAGKGQSQTEAFGINHKNAVYKQIIAQATANLVSDGETLFINSGSTTFYVAQALKKCSNLNIVTNSVAVATVLSAQPGFRTILLGGLFNPQYSFSYGDDANEQLKKYKADKAILALDGISESGGLTTYHAEEAMLNGIMMERSRQTIIAADHTKFGHESFSHVAEISMADYVVTDNKADSRLVSFIREQGPKVLMPED